MRCSLPIIILNFFLLQHITRHLLILSLPELKYHSDVTTTIIDVAALVPGRFSSRRYSRKTDMKSESSSTIARKVVLLGEQNVGKTCIVLRYVEGTYSGKDVTSTIGAFFLSKKLTVNKKNVKLQIWDTAGQERFRAMAPMYYRGAHAAILVFDVTDMKSFATMKGWVSELIENLSPTDGGICLSIACNKIDEKRNRQVPQKMIADFAKSVGALLFETSAKTGQGIDKLFKETTEAMIAAKEKRDQALLKNRSIQSPLLEENLRVRNLRMKKMMSTTNLNDYNNSNGNGGCC